jgi:hypothetical protein
MATCLLRVRLLPELPAFGSQFFDTREVALCRFRAYSCWEFAYCGTNSETEAMTDNEGHECGTSGII